MPVIGPENRLLLFSLSQLPGCGEALALRSDADLPHSADDSPGQADRATPPCRESLEARVPNGMASVHNPLVLVGEEGSGKTEFLNFVARSWCGWAGVSETDSATARRVLRWTGRSLACDLRSGLESDTWHRLHARFRAAELLLVDGLDQCVETELLGFFTALLDLTTADGGLAVITLARLPGEDASLPRSLVTRLREGLIVKVHPPEQPSRRAIVRSIARRRGLAIDEASVARLAARETDPGSLDRAIGTIAAEGVGRVEARHVTDLLDNGSTRRNLSPRRIITLTARQHGLKFEDVVGPSRHRRVAHARSMAIYLVRRLTQKSLVEVGACFGGRDHTTVLHSVRVMKKRYETDSDCRRAVEGILMRLAE